MCAEQSSGGGGPGGEGITGTAGLQERLSANAQGTWPFKGCPRSHVLL